MDGCRSDLIYEGRPEEAALALLIASLAEAARQELALAAAESGLGAAGGTGPYLPAGGDLDV